MRGEGCDHRHAGADDPDDDEDDFGTYQEKRLRKELEMIDFLVSLQKSHFWSVIILLAGIAFWIYFVLIPDRKAYKELEKKWENDKKKQDLFDSRRPIILTSYAWAVRLVAFLSDTTISTVINKTHNNTSHQYQYFQSALTCLYRDEGQWTAF